MQPSISHEQSIVVLSTPSSGWEIDPMREFQFANSAEAGE
jgi:hypothetical protein